MTCYSNLLYPYLLPTPAYQRVPKCGIESGKKWRLIRLCKVPHIKSAPQEFETKEKFVRHSSSEHDIQIAHNRIVSKILDQPISSGEHYTSRASIQITRKPSNSVIGQVRIMDISTGAVFRGKGPSRNR